MLHSTAGALIIGAGVGAVAAPKRVKGAALGAVGALGFRFIENMITNQLVGRDLLGEGMLRALPFISLVAIVAGGYAGSRVAKRT